MFHQGWKFGCDCCRNQRRKCNSFRRQIHLWKCKKFVKFVQKINKEIFSLPRVCLFKSSVEKTLMEKQSLQIHYEVPFDIFFYKSMMSRNIFKETQSWIDENLKPKTCRFRTIVISYNSLPECQCDGNFRPPSNLKIVDQLKIHSCFVIGWKIVDGRKFP